MASTLPALVLLMTVAQCWGYTAYYPAYTTQGPNNFDCDFAYGTCGWQQSYFDDFDWTRNSGSTSSSSTGPSGDHTTGYGYYMYIETSSPRYSGQVARLTSPSAQYSSGPQCLTFWYHMYGGTINSLNVYKSASSTASGGDVLFSRTGQVGDVWNEAQVTMNNNTQPFYITFEGVCGSSFTGDIAIDDIVLSQGSCQQGCASNQFQCNNGTCIPGSWECDGIVDCADNSDEDHCDFSTNSWYQSTPGYQSCYSWQFQCNDGSCISDYYRCNGYSNCGDGSDEYNCDYSTSSWYQPTQGYQSCYSWQFQCNDGSCISDYYRCNGYSNCYDGSDEYNCDYSTSSWYQTTQGAVPDDFDCNFESGLCGWQQAYGDDFDWTRKSGSTGSSGTGPSGDHTTGYGYYMYIETSSPRVYGDFARLWSSAQYRYGSYCLTFWYHMYGNAINSLNVYKSETTFPNSTDSIFSLSGQKGSYWGQAQVSIYNSGYYYDWPFYITMEGIRGNDFTGDIAIDDISMLHGYCQQAYTTDYPDYTTQGYQSCYSWQFQCNDGSCISDYYRCNGYSNCYDGSDEYNCDYSTSSWYQPTQGYQSCYSWQFQCNDGSCISDYYRCNGYSNCGDGSDEYNCDYSTSSWYQTTQVPDDFDCNFESGLCGWQQAYGDDFDWSRHSGSTGSQNTGPSGDHTTGYGYYMYIETSSPRVYGDFARLWSPAQYLYGSYCLTFWYHMYGSTINSLNVYKSETTFPNSTDSIFSLSGQKGSYWGQAQVSIYNSGYYYDWPFYITMEGIRGNDFTGDIAIDDISMLHGYCQQAYTTDYPDYTTQGYQSCYSWQFQCYDGTCISDYYRCNGYSNCGDGSDEYNCDYSTSSWYQTTQDPGEFDCDFESGLCGWQQAYYGDDFDWTRNSGSTPSSSTGPSVDHTSGTYYGYYMYIEATPRAYGDVARLWSPAYSGYGYSCLTFWSHMYGSTINTLNVYKSESRSPNATDILYSVSGERGNYWSQTQISIYNYYWSFYITMEGVRGSSFTSDIAIDDISISPGYCQQGGYTTQGYHYCGSWQFQCNNGYCIPDYWQCNGYNDCSDGSDEYYCGGYTTQDPGEFDCDFESGLCGWQQAYYGDDFDWTRYSGSTPSSSTGPSVDHTYGTYYGYYMYIETSSGYNGIVARLWSPAYNGNGYSCLTFWSHMYGSTINTLNVYKSESRSPNATDILYSYSGERGNYWSQTQISIYNYYRSFYITMEGVHGSSFTGDIAIDDISISPGYCQLAYTTDYPEYTTQVYQYCGSWQFQCNDGNCIPDYCHCDGYLDCSDGSDENDCRGNATPGSSLYVDGLRLSNGSRYYEGRVEVSVGYQWGTICDDSWDLNDANVICKMLGYSGASSALQSAYFGEGSGPIWMDDVHCSGIEMDISQCPHNGFGSHNCVHGEDAGVICYGYCNSWDYPCNDGQCIPDSWECDGIVDCSDGGDENNCGGYSTPGDDYYASTPASSCNYGDFICNNGQCIPGNWECDGINDCSDNSDEHYYCSPTYVTEPMPYDGSCYGFGCNCVGSDCRSSDCYCDAACERFNDCCYDYSYYCPNTGLANGLYYIQALDALPVEVRRRRDVNGKRRRRRRDVGEEEGEDTNKTRRRRRRDDVEEEEAEAEAEVEVEVEPEQSEE
ncbi:MAM and LDL-receptor class A domain-containing protein 2-like isoform X3 [Diadema antillarum]|uniref:MAM and LDL-receptor class A domain-containing protein 2-like isoform X3 n=1 Tax=Diadema antillarum TaxID=105358 RepID=UPI003A83A094